MHPVLFYESFSFCSRNDLERLQLVRRSLMNMIVAGSNTLPLRPIHRVFMDVINLDKPDAEIQIFFKEDEDDDEEEPDYEASLHDGDFAETFRRLQHTCIKYFDVWIVASPFLSYWMAQGAAAFTVVYIKFHIEDTMLNADFPIETGYEVFDSIVNHVRPKTTLIVAEGYGWQEDAMNNVDMKALARRSLLNTLQTCLLETQPGYAKYELWCLHRNAGKWIDDFIESFLRAGCTNRKLDSVFVRWDDDKDHPSPAPKQLSRPTKSEMPFPKKDMTAWLADDARPVTQCEVHSFVSTKYWIRMDVYKWNDYDDSDPHCVTHILQCRVSDL